MNQQQNNADTILAQWVTAEQWFMRGSGVTLFVVAAISAFTGLIANPDNEVPLEIINVVFILLLIAGGFWAIWSSTRVDGIRKMVERFTTQSPNRLRVNGTMQVVVALLFFLEGLSRGAVGVLLIGLLLIVSAIWSFWRAEQIIALQSA